MRIDSKNQTGPSISPKFGNIIGFLRKVDLGPG